MGDILAKVVGVLLQHGLLGVVVMAQSYWIWKLSGQLFEIQEQRVKDAYKLAETVTACASSLERNTEVLNALMDS